MEENRQLRELMLRIDESNRKQAKYAKLQCIFSAVAAVCCIAVLVTALMLMPELRAITTQAEEVIGDIQQVSSQLARADWEGLVSDLEGVSKQLAEADLAGLAEDVSGLVQTSQSGLEEVLKKLNAIDLETLNDAIADLAAVVEPLARFFNLF